jgi:N6-L-threonylcarbamoyladenine synthase
MCKSFETNVVEVLVENTLRAMKDFNVNKVVLAGGVSANTFLREHLTNECNKLNYLVYLPDLEYCTDNAAMIGSAAYYNYISKDKDKFNILDNLSLNAVANLKIGG